MYSVTASGNTVNYRVHTSLRRPSVSLGSGTSLMDGMKVETRSAVGSDSQPHLGELEIVYYLKNKKKKTAKAVDNRASIQGPLVHELQ